MSSTFDGLSLTNSRDLTCNNIYLKYDNDIRNIFDIFATRNNVSDITGLAPETLNSLQELADALNNNPNFFQYVRNQLDTKRDINDSYDKNYINTLILSYYTKSQTDSLLNNKLNSSEMIKYYTITQMSNLYLDKATWNANIPNIVNSLAGKVEGSTLIDYYYNKLTTNSILETNYYNKSHIDSKFNERYTITDVDALLENYYDQNLRRFNFEYHL